MRMLRMQKILRECLQYSHMRRRFSSDHSIVAAEVKTNLNSKIQKAMISTTGWMQSSTAGAQP